MVLNSAYAALEAVEKWLKAQLPAGHWDGDGLYTRAFYPDEIDEHGENEIVDYTAVVDKYGVLKLVKRTTTVD